MPKKKSKGKPASRPRKKKASRTVPWLKVAVFASILLGVLLYLGIRYTTVYPPREKREVSYQSDRLAVNLYFADPERDGLKAERRSIAPGDALSTTITRTLQELIRGPQGKLINAIPANTRILDVRIDRDGVAWVDFSTQLSRAHPGGSSAEIMTVYSIVNTVLLNFKEIKRVGILIDGSSVDTLAGHIDCTDPFAADRRLIH